MHIVSSGLIVAVIRQEVHIEHLVLMCSHEYVFRHSGPGRSSATRGRTDVTRAETRPARFTSEMTNRTGND